MISPRRIRVLTLASLLSVTALSACSSSDSCSATPSGTTAQSHPGTASAHLGGLQITGGYIPKPASPDVAAAYFTVTNTGSTPDSLVKVSSSVTGSVMAMTESDKGGAGRMTDLSHVAIPAHGTFRFTPGHAHLMLEKPMRTLGQGDKVTMTITFAKAGTVALTLPVVPLTGPVAQPTP